MTNKERGAFMKNAPIERKEGPAYPVDIFIAGNIGGATHVCREYCMDVGLCVTITPAEYVYTGGQEAGARIGLINYPRFPTTPADLFNKAVALAEILIVRLCQGSAIVQSPDRTLWLTRRGDNS